MQTLAIVGVILAFIVVSLQRLDSEEKMNSKYDL